MIAPAGDRPHTATPRLTSGVLTSLDARAAPWFTLRSPNESDAGSVKTSGSSAASTLARPAPASVTGATTVLDVFSHAGPAVVIRADLICCGVHPGWSWTRSAAAPLTWGAAMLVPSKTEKPDGSNCLVTEERMSPPGATSSGLS